MPELRFGSSRWLGVGNHIAILVHTLGTVAPYYDVSAFDPFGAQSFFFLLSSVPSPPRLPKSLLEGPTRHRDGEVLGTGEDADSFLPNRVVPEEKSSNEWTFRSKDTKQWCTAILCDTFRSEKQRQTAKIGLWCGKIRAAAEIHNTPGPSRSNPIRVPTSISRQVEGGIKYIAVCETGRSCKEKEEKGGVVWRRGARGRGNGCGGQFGTGEARSVSGANARLGLRVRSGYTAGKGRVGRGRRVGSEQGGREGESERKEGEKEGKDEDCWDWHRHCSVDPKRKALREVSGRRGIARRLAVWSTANGQSRSAGGVHLSSGLEVALFRGRESAETFKIGWVFRREERRTRDEGKMGLCAPNPGSQSSRRESARAACGTLIGIDGPGRLVARWVGNEQ
ncbi:hypothetical protein DFH08DRAFT_803964 [Mycena albidolilacea]|uniref:Uncharacterized protein n=1 Tax=Mycena albidolilacea TaxID=1033008 RepID=A0AAD7AB62_9AGAR|nr:hypothetical protein DFH08DRAFT_803964 [Mycena albidolilacea]